MAHDSCYAKGGFTAGDNFGGSNTALQGCNQQLCDSVRGRRRALLETYDIGTFPAIPPDNVRNELNADNDINEFFSHFVFSNGCHR